RWRAADRAGRPADPPNWGRCLPGPCSRREMAVNRPSEADRDGSGLGRWRSGGTRCRRRTGCRRTQRAGQRSALRARRQTTRTPRPRVQSTTSSPAPSLQPKLEATKYSRAARNRTVTRSCATRSPRNVGPEGLVPGEGLEPPTFGLQNRCTTAVLTRPGVSYRKAAGSVEPFAEHETGLIVAP